MCIYALEATTYLPNKVPTKSYLSNPNFVRVQKRNKKIEKKEKKKRNKKKKRKKKEESKREKRR